MSGFTAFPQRDSQMVGFPQSLQDNNYGSNTIAGIRVTEFGGEKSSLSRAIVNFDISALSGRTLSAAKMIVVPSVTDKNVTAIISRCTRPADWTEAGVTWNEYTIGAIWTSGGGGDVDDTGPPASVNYTTHNDNNIEHEITGLLAFATDALANRNGIVSLVFRLDEEEPDPASNDGEGIYTRERTQLLKWRFVVEHSGPPILWRERGFLRGVQRGVSRGV